MRVEEEPETFDLLSIEPDGERRLVTLKLLGRDVAISLQGIPRVDITRGWLMSDSDVRRAFGSYYNPEITACLARFVGDCIQRNAALPIRNIRLSNLLQSVSARLSPADDID